MERGGKRQGAGRPALACKRKMVGFVLSLETIGLLQEAVPASKRSRWIEGLILAQLKKN